MASRSRISCSSVSARFFELDSSDSLFCCAATSAKLLPTSRFIGSGLAADAFPSLPTFLADDESAASSSAMRASFCSSRARAALSCSFNSDASSSLSEALLELRSYLTRC